VPNEGSAAYRLDYPQVQHQLYVAGAELGYPDPALERAILAQALPALPETIAERMVRVANEVRRLFVGEGEGGRELTLTLSTRTLVRWAHLALTFKGAPNVLEYALA
jgi:cobaltochelatase CobS